MVGQPHLGCVSDWLTVITLLPGWEVGQPPSCSLPLSANCLLIGITTCYFPNPQALNFPRSHPIFIPSLIRSSPQYFPLSKGTRINDIGQIM